MATTDDQSTDSAETNDQSTDSADTDLPDFSGSAATSSSAHLPEFATTHDPVTMGEPTSRARNRARNTIIAVISAVVVLLAIIALVLSQTVFRSPEPPPGAGGDTPEKRQGAQGQNEYVPDPDDPELAPPPPIFTEEPTVSCHVPPDSRSRGTDADGKVTGGNLQFTAPTTWDTPWIGGGVPYLTDVGAQGRNVESSWYSVVNVGKVEFPDDEGGYPGLEQAAVAIFQCYATTAGVLAGFGEKPTVTDYRSEATTVDGAQAWIVQATYHFEDPGTFSTTSASVVTSIVVETPDGPSALASDVAADHEDHRRELDEIIESLTVV